MLKRLSSLVSLLSFVFLYQMSFAQDIKILNKGVGGNSTVNMLARVNADVIDHKPDLVIMMVGTNDMLNSRKMMSYADYSNNLEELALKIKESGSQLLLMSSPPADSAYLFERHDRSLFTESPNEIMRKVSVIVEGLAVKHDLLFVNLYEDLTAMSIPRHNEDLLIRNVRNCGKGDGVHPTPLGYHFIGQTVYQYLKENKMLKSFDKIICFGDSITKGSGAKGGGTVTGENYPSYLNRLLNPEQ